MIMNQKGKGNDYFETPAYIFEQLNNVFKFTLDVAANTSNRKTEFFIDEKQNALKTDWGRERCFCNPPFSKKAEFIEKAYNEVMNANCPICVMILPLNSMDTKAWHKFIEGKFHYEILQGRIAFIDPNTGMPKSGNNSGTVIVYFKKRIEIRR